MGRGLAIVANIKEAGFFHAHSDWICCLSGATRIRMPIGGLRQPAKICYLSEPATISHPVCEIRGLTRCEYIEDVEYAV